MRVVGLACLLAVAAIAAGCGATRYAPHTSPLPGRFLPAAVPLLATSIATPAAPTLEASSVDAVGSLVPDRIAPLVSFDGPNEQVIIRRVPPTLLSLTPNSGIVGDSVVIAGRDFGLAQENTVVRVNGVVAVATAWSDTSATITIPTTTSGSVTMIRGGLTSNGLPLTVNSVASNCTPTVFSLTQTAIQNALTGAAAGTTANPTVVCLAAGTGTISSSITGTVAANVTLMGQTTCTGANSTLACTDGTTLTMGSAQLFNLTLSSTGTFRMSGLTPKGLSCGDHAIEISAPGATSYAQMRLDHNHWDHICNFNFTFNALRGVADHNYFDNSGGGQAQAGFNEVRPYGMDNDNEWTHTSDFGTQNYNWFVLEDNRWEFGIASDAHSSARQTFRNNYINRSGLQSHGFGHAGENRGVRAFEAYDNVIIGDSVANRTAAIALYGGSGRIFRNHYTMTCPDIGNGSCANAVGLDLVEDRQSDYTYHQDPIPGDSGYCGTKFNGVGSVLDGNLDVSGYPCFDQVGRGRGDLMSGFFPTKQNVTRGCTMNFTWGARAANCDGSDSSMWPRQDLDPVYEWLNDGTLLSGVFVSVFLSGGSGGTGIANIQANRDYYQGHGNSNCNANAAICAAGVGSGLLSQMPVSCTAGVGYWATDMNALYLCGPTANKWHWDYSPLTYPHPLLGALPVNNYATNFPTVENPIAEQNSVWTNGSAAGGSLWGNLQVVAGNMVRGVSQPTTFGDPTAILKGTWSANQGAQAVVHTVGTPSADSEVEIRLRATVSANSITGYEAYCSAAPADRYCHIASWGGPNGSFSNNETTCFTETHAPSACPARNNDASLAYVVDGDTLSATVTGTNPVIISLFINGVERERASDDGTWTFSSGGSHGPWTTGNPGFGFYSSTGVFTTHGFTKFSAIGQ